MPNYTYCSFAPIAAAAATFFLSTPVGALDIGANVGAGGATASVGANLGSRTSAQGSVSLGGGTSAQGSVSLGGGASAQGSVSTGGGTSAQGGVSLGGQATTATGSASATTVQSEATAGAGGGVLDDPLALLIGLTVMSSDKVPLGTISGATRRPDGRINLRVALSNYLRTERKVASVVVKDIRQRSRWVHLPITADRFIERL